MEKGISMDILWIYTSWMNFGVICNQTMAYVHCTKIVQTFEPDLIVSETE